MGLDYTLQVITEGGASSVWPGGCSVPPRSYHLSDDRIGTLAKAGPLPSQSYVSLHRAMRGSPPLPTPGDGRAASNGV